MSLVRGRGNKSTELAMIRQFRSSGVKGWRRSIRLAGRPDFVFPRLQLAVFVDGCFWHGCPRHHRTPRSNNRYWSEKISRNMARDKATNKILKSLGWKVVRVWEHDIKNCRGVGKVLKTIEASRVPRSSAAGKLRGNQAS